MYDVRSLSESIEVAAGLSAQPFQLNLFGQEFDGEGQLTDAFLLVARHKDSVVRRAHFDFLCGQILKFAGELQAAQYNAL